MSTVTLTSPAPSNPPNIVTIDSYLKSSAEEDVLWGLDRVVAVGHKAAQRHRYQVLALVRATTTYNIWRAAVRALHTIDATLWTEHEGILTWHNLSKRRREKPVDPDAFMVVHSND